MDNSIDAIKSIANIDDLTLFCHYTNANPIYILEEGLKLVENDWHTTLLKLNSEEREDIESFIEREKSVPSEVNFRDHAIILAVPQEFGEAFIQNNHDDAMPYIIDSRFIVGSVDTSNYDTVLNENAVAWDYVLYR